MKAPALVTCVAVLLGGCIEMPTQWTPAPVASAPAPVAPAPVPVAPAPAVAVPTPMGPPPQPAYLPPPPAYVEPAPPPPPPVLPVVTDRDIVAVYHDLLGRPPSRDEVHEWRRRSREMPITLDQIAASLRDTGEYRRRAVQRAYRELLERDADRAGFDRYVRQMEQGTSEEDIRHRIRQSEEYRVTLPDSKTRRAYREVLGRDPDEGGLQHYRKLIVDKGWSEDDVENDLRKSAEYRNRRK